MTDLGLDLFRTKGRAARPVAAEVVGEVSRSDLALLGTERGTKAAPLKRIGERHHSLARMLAGGMKPGEAAVAVGLHPSRVSILQDDPTFAELVKFYRENVDAVYANLHERLAGMSADAAEELRRRLEDNPEELGLGSLMEMVKLGADRTGHGPTSRQEVNVTHNIADRLQAARQRHSRLIEGEVVDAEQIEEAGPDDAGGGS